MPGVSRLIACLIGAGLCGFSAAAEDATTHAPSEFQSDIYIEQDTEDFCNTQNSGRPCIEVTIKNRSRATLDWADESKNGSLTGSGALEAFQVFEIPGCIDVVNLPYAEKKSMSDKDKFTRRMREEKLHYWKPGADKTIKVLQGCTYAVAVKREDGDKNWQFTYVPPAAKDGCTLEYKYVTTSADLETYEQWAGFGAIGTGSLTFVGDLGYGSYVAYKWFTAYTGMARDGFIMSEALEDAALEGLSASGVGLVVVVAAPIVWEAGVWGTFGLDTLGRKLDGKRDFIISKECYTEN